MKCILWARNGHIGCRERYQEHDVTTPRPQREPQVLSLQET
jgi:hypothetical protein